MTQDQRDRQLEPDEREYDEWAAYEAVNDPASGKKLPNEGHAVLGPVHDNVRFGSEGEDEPIYITDSCLTDIKEIYSGFSQGDDEYPSMGISIQGAPILVACVRFPDCAVIRRPASDYVNREHPDVSAEWARVLHSYEGKCRSTTLHIHPMNHPWLSSQDVRNFDSLRANPDDPSTFPEDHPYPVVLVNLSSSGQLELCGFWIMGGQSRPTPVELVPDDDPIVIRAWEDAEPMPFFSKEAVLARRIDEMVGDEWRVEFGLNPVTEEKALRAQRTEDDSRVLLKFSDEAPLGLVSGETAELDLFLEKYVDWNGILDDLAGDPVKAEGDAAAQSVGAEPVVTG